MNDPASSQQRPLALTMGDPAGIGPEIIIVALAANQSAAPGPTVVIGSHAVMTEAAATVRARPHDNQAGRA